MKEELYTQFARIGRAMASPKRLEILDLLAQGEKTVEQVSAQAAVGLKNASAHLRTLREARLVQTRKAPPYVYYRLADAAVLAALRQVQALASARLAEVERMMRLYVEARDELEALTAVELRRRLEQGDVTVLDVRPVDEYAAAHIPQALSVPLEELERRLAEIPRDREVVAYCRGPYCVFAVEAVQLLRARGYTARRLEVGLPDWGALGYAVDRGLTA